VKLPKIVRDAMKDAGLTESEVVKMSGDELIARIGEDATYQFAVVRAKEGHGFTGQKGDADLWDRNLEVVRLRLLEKQSYAEIGRAVGVSRSRVDQILSWLYGIDRSGRAMALRVPAAAVPVMRDALLHLFTWRTEELLTALKARGRPDLPRALDAFDQARSLVNQVGASAHDPETPLEVWIGHKRRSLVLKALRDYLATERDVMEAAEDETERERATMRATTCELLLGAMP